MREGNAKSSLTARDHSDKCNKGERGRDFFYDL